MSEVIEILDVMHDIEQGGRLYFFVVSNTLMVKEKRETFASLQPLFSLLQKAHANKHPFMKLSINSFRPNYWHSNSVIIRYVQSFEIVFITDLITILSKLVISKDSYCNQA